MRDWDNLILVFVSISGVIEVLLIYSNRISLTHQLVGYLRIVKILRMITMAQKWTSLGDLLRKLGKTLKDIRSFSILLLIVIVTYALIG